MAVRRRIRRRVRFRPRVGVIWEAPKARKREFEVVPIVLPDGNVGIIIKAPKLGPYYLPPIINEDMTVPLPKKYEVILRKELGNDFRQLLPEVVFVDYGQLFGTHSKSSRKKK